MSSVPRTVGRESMEMLEELFQTENTESSPVQLVRADRGPGRLGLSEGEDSGAGRGGDYLTLKVSRPSQDLDNLEIHFRVKPTTQMGKLKRCYCERVGVSVDSLRFLFEGRRIMDEATPGGLEMESGDSIEVYHELGGGELELGLVGRSRGRLEPGPTVGVLRGLRQPSVKDDEPEIVERPGGATRQSDGRGSFTENQGRASKRPRLDETAAEAVAEARTTGYEVAAELAAVKAKYDDLVRKLRDKVECPVCFEVPKSAPVPVCPNGHVVCVRCAREECPTCRVRMQQGSSTLAVTVIENIAHICEYEGCDLEFPLSELARHHAVCLARPAPCPGPSCSLRHLFFINDALICYGFALARSR